MKLIEIIFDNVPKIAIVFLILYTYFFIGRPQALVVGSFLLLSRVTDAVIAHEKGRSEHEET